MKDENFFEIFKRLRNDELRLNGKTPLVIAKEIIYHTGVLFSQISSCEDWENKIRRSDLRENSSSLDVVRYCYEYINCFYETEFKDSEDDMIDGFPSVIILLKRFDDEVIKVKIEGLYKKWNSKGGNVSK